MSTLNTRGLKHTRGGRNERFGYDRHKGIGQEKGGETSKEMGSPVAYSLFHWGFENANVPPAGGGNGARKGDQVKTRNQQSE